MRITTLLIITSILLWDVSAYSQEKLEIGGAIIIGTSEDPSPAPGTIRYNPSTSDFEGYDGIGWKSLIKSAGPSGSGMVTDIDGNQYLTVTIGTQTWMRENLRTSRYCNQDLITEVLLNSDWDALSTEAWSWSDHDPEKDKIYGKLYNWYAVNDSRGLCPTGWHVPTDEEWTTLTTFLGGTAVAGGKMKTKGTIEAGTGYWRDPNTGATNESGFTGLPGGLRNTSGTFFNIGMNGYWWGSAETGSDAWVSALNSTSTTTSEGFLDKNFGFSVRCVRND